MTLPQIVREFRLPKPHKPPFNLEAPSNLPVKMASYGDELAKNKFQLWRDLCRSSLTAEEKRILVAIAMAETTHMALRQRDTSKDETVAKNVSIFNMNLDMLNQLGYKRQDRGGWLNTQEGQLEACLWAGLAMRKWTPKRFLDFHRGGRTGFNDGVSYDCLGYRTAIATIMPYLRADLSLARDNPIRCEVNVPHV